jgi:hypothetical protein
MCAGPEPPGLQEVSDESTRDHASDSSGDRRKRRAATEQPTGKVTRLCAHHRDLDAGAGEGWPLSRNRASLNNSGTHRRLESHDQNGAPGPPNRLPTCRGEEALQPCWRLASNADDHHVDAVGAKNCFVSPHPGARCGSDDLGYFAEIAGRIRRGNPRRREDV